MARSSTFEIMLDSGSFNPIQMQTTAVCRLAFQAGTRWLRDHVCSHRTLITKHQIGFVLWALQLNYQEPLRYVDADEATVEVRGQLRGPRSSQLQIEMTITGPAGVAIRTHAVSVPLDLSGDTALSGIPKSLPDTFKSSFQNDEIEPSPYFSPVRALCGEIAREGVLLTRYTSQFRIHQHHCESADQWYWAETLSFAGSAREELIIKSSDKLPELRRALADGIRHVDTTWLRAGQLWDLMEMRTIAYSYGKSLAFVHELGVVHDPKPYALIVERT